MDEISLKRIEKLHPKVRGEAFQILEEIHKATTTPKSFCRFSYTLRIAAEQHALYLKRPKVTNADAWQSIHNYGLALDIVFIVNNAGSWEINKDWDGDGISD